MQNVFICPPGLVVVIDVFGEAAHIHDAEMRTDIRPDIRCWFAAVVNTSPDKPAKPEIIVGGQGPPGFRRTGPPGRCDVLIGHIGPDAIFFINTPRSNGATHFGADNWLIGVIAVVISHGKLSVIETAHRDHFIHTFIDVGQVGGISGRASRVEFVLFFQQRFGNVFTGRSRVNPAFFIADRPHEYAGSAAVAFQ